MPDNRRFLSLVQDIHAAPGRGVVAITGGGSGAIAELLTVPGASRTVLEAIVPYAAAALDALLDGPPESYCAPSTARAMAMAAILRARRYAGAEGGPCFGVGCTASLASDRTKRGPHRAYVALQTLHTTSVRSLHFDHHRSRSAEETRCAALVLEAVAQGCGLQRPAALDLSETERLDAQRAQAPAEWSELLFGSRRALLASGPDDGSSATLIFPGSFNPLHVGHRAMIKWAEQQSGQKVALEISVANVDKRPLDFLEIQQRLAGLSIRPVWLTRAPTFAEKAAQFPGATFLVGADTLMRIADPAYYAGDPRRRDDAIERIGTADCRLLVFGRLVGEQFRTLGEIDIPDALRGLCTGVPGGAFREDVCSTQLRHPRADGGD